MENAGSVNEGQRINCVCIQRLQRSHFCKWVFISVLFHYFSFLKNIDIIKCSYHSRKRFAAYIVPFLSSSMFFSLSTSLNVKPFKNNPAMGYRGCRSLGPMLRLKRHQKFPHLSLDWVRLECCVLRLAYRLEFCCVICTVPGHSTSCFHRTWSGFC